MSDHTDTIRIAIREGFGSHAAAEAALDALVARCDAERKARKAAEKLNAEEVLRQRTNLHAQIESLQAERDALENALREIATGTTRESVDDKVIVTCHCGQRVAHEQWCGVVPRLIPPAGERQET